MKFQYDVIVYLSKEGLFWSRSTAHDDDDDDAILWQIQCHIDTRNEFNLDFFKRFCACIFFWIAMRWDNFNGIIFWNFVANGHLNADIYRPLYVYIGTLVGDSLTLSKNHNSFENKWENSNFINGFN